MNVFDTIQALRPDADPMPMDDRRMIRETLFGVGHIDSTGNIRTRSESGAVVSTAPHGSGRPLRSRPDARGSVPRIAAGLLVLAALGALGWSFVTRPDDEASAPTTVTTDPPATTTTTTSPPPTTEPPLVRTGVTAESPLVLPTTRLTAAEVSIDPASSDDSAAVLSAPDGSSLWIAEVDGAESGSFGLDVRRVGLVDLGVEIGRDENTLTSYRPVVPCGFVLVNEGIGQPYDRPSTIELFASMSIDNDATIDVNLPTGWSIIDVGPTRTRYTTLFQVPGADVVDLVSFSQIPGGSIAQFAGNGQRLTPTTFLGGPAFVDAGPLDPSTVSLYWRDVDTVFNVSSATLGAAELATLVDTMEPVAIEEWEQRFGATAAPLPEVDTNCSPQPSFGSTLDP